MRIPDPLEGYFAPQNLGRCMKPICECEPGDTRLCTTCTDEWAAMLSDAEIHEIEDTPPEDDPWLDEVRDPLESDDDVFDRMAMLEDYPDA